MPLFSKTDREAQPITVKDRQLRCSHCSHETFYAEQVPLNFRTLTNERVICFECAECSQLHFFRGQEG